MAVQVQIWALSALVHSAHVRGTNPSPPPANQRTPTSEAADVIRILSDRLTHTQTHRHTDTQDKVLLLYFMAGTV